MITKEEWLEIRSGWKRMNDLRDLVIEKFKEKEEIRTGSKWNEDNEIENVEFYPEDDGYDYDHFSLDVRYGRGGCAYTESGDSLDVKFLYDESSMVDYRKEIEERRRRFIETKIKEQESDRKRKEDAEKDNLFELAKKHGYILARINKTVF